LAQTCGGLIDRIEKSIYLTDEQLKALDVLKNASSQASDALKASCSSEVALTPVGRLDAVQKRADGIIQALGIIRNPLDNFYTSLNVEQRHRFAELGPSTRRFRRGSTPTNDFYALCSHRIAGFTQLPIERIEQVIKPTQQQQDALDKLKAASTEGTNKLQASCPPKRRKDQPKGLTLLPCALTQCRRLLRQCVLHSKAFMGL
jgi:hypothetical protein